MTGVDTTNIDPSSFIDDLLGNRDGNTVRVAANLVAAQFAAETPGPNYETRALLYADLAWPAGTRGVAWGDATEAWRGIYTKSGPLGQASMR